MNGKRLPVLPHPSTSYLEPQTNEQKSMGFTKACHLIINKHIKNSFKLSFLNESFDLQIARQPRQSQAI
jgi:hypothetical protein